MFLLTKQAFKLSLKYFQKIIKQLLNSVLAGYKELLRPRFVLFTLITQTSALIIPHILLDLIIGVRGGGAGGAAAPPIFRDQGKSGNLCLKSRAI